MHSDLIMRLQEEEMLQIQSGEISVAYLLKDAWKALYAVDKQAIAEINRIPAILRPKDTINE